MTGHDNKNKGIDKDAFKSLGISFEFLNQIPFQSLRKAIFVDNRGGIFEDKQILMLHDPESREICHGITSIYNK